MRQAFAAMAVAAVVGLIAGSALYVRMQRADDPFAECRGGQVAGGDIGGPFTLVNTSGATVTERDVITGPTLVYFGYTFCPDICPTDAARNADAVDILARGGTPARHLFISVDPARDTPGVLRDFVSNLDEGMIGLTGTEAQVKAASDAYRTFYRVSNPEDEYYLMDHTTLTYLMMPDADGTPVFLDFFKSEVSPQEMAARVACYAAAG
ncbi:MAG: SCO family protein [Gemmobacter sp.]